MTKINHSSILVSLLILGFVLSSSAASEVIRDSVESRLIRMNPYRKEGIGEKNIPLSLETDVPKKWSWSTDFGVAYTDAQDGSEILSTPLRLTGVSFDKKTQIRIQGDGYIHIAGTTSASGFGDPTVILLRLISSGNAGSFSCGGGVTIPVRGEVGLIDPIERFLGIYTTDLSEKWNIALIGAVLHNEAKQSAGLGRYSQSAALQLAYSFSEKVYDGVKKSSGVLAQFSASHQNGGRSQTAGLIEYDFPINKRWSGAVSIGRGFTDGFRDSSLEFDLSYSFD